MSPPRIPPHLCQLCGGAPSTYADDGPLCTECRAVLDAQFPPLATTAQEPSALPPGAWPTGHPRHVD